MLCKRIIAASAILLIAGCGRVAELQPAPGKSLPVKPLMAKTTPKAEDLLAVPTYARADRVDELMKRSEPRPQDPFDLPPAAGGSAPVAGTDPQPADTSTGPVPSGE
jgi:hypothetical protein